MVARPFSYTNRDYASLLVDLRRRMQVAIPEWTSYDGGFESILLELQAYVGDQLNFYTDRMAAEAYLQTAAMRESILNIAQMFNYRPAAQTAASCTVQFTKVSGSGVLSEAVTIPAGTQLFAQSGDAPPVFFETATAVTIAPATTTATVTAVEGRTETMELAGVSNGAERQSLILHYDNVIRDSIRVYTKSGVIDPSTNQPSLIEWTYFSDLIDANFYDNAFSLYVNEDGYAFITFGDGVSGLIPTVGAEIYVTYRHGVGSVGNVGVGSVRSFVVGGPLMTKIASVSNTTPAMGGTDRESIESMRTSIPKSLTTIERAVSLQDYANLSLRVPGIAKASAAATIATSVLLYVGPVGGGQPTTILTTAVDAYFTGPPSRKMIGTDITIAGPTYVPINITISLTVNPRHRRDVVSDAVKTVVTNLYQYDTRSFGELMTKARIFREVVDIPGVDIVDITVFSRSGAGTTDVQLAVNEIATLGTLTINATGGVVLP